MLKKISLVLITVVLIFFAYQFTNDFSKKYKLLNNIKEYINLATVNDLDLLESQGLDIYYINNKNSILKIHKILQKGKVININNYSLKPYNISIRIKNIKISVCGSFLVTDYVTLSISDKYYSDLMSILSEVKK